MFQLRRRQFHTNYVVFHSRQATMSHCLTASAICFDVFIRYGKISLSPSCKNLHSPLWVCWSDSTAHRLSSLLSSPSRLCERFALRRSYISTNLSKLCAELETEIATTERKLGEKRELNRGVLSGATPQRFRDTMGLVQALRRTIVNCGLLDNVRHLEKDFEIFHLGEELGKLAHEAERGGGGMVVGWWQWELAQFILVQELASDLSARCYSRKHHLLPVMSIWN